MNTGGSTSGAIEDCQIKTDLCYVDAILANAVYGIIRTSKLSFNLSTFNTSMNVLTSVSADNGQFSTQFATSYTRIQTIFFTLGTPEFNNTSPRDAGLNETNAFYWPARLKLKDPADANYGMYHPEEDVVEFTMPIGYRKFPMDPISSQSECAYHLAKALDLTASLEGTSITPARYRTERFIIGIDVEAPGTGPSG